MQQPRNARFWVHVNGGPVKLTLRPDQELSWGYAVRTDEGWASESYTWSHEGDHVRLKWCDDGVDCDGRLTRYGESHASLDELLVDPPSCSDSERHVYENVLWPLWRKDYAGQRDEYAEMAGY